MTVGGTVAHCKYGCNETVDVTVGLTVGLTVIHCRCDCSLLYPTVGMTVYFNKVNFLGNNTTYDPCSLQMFEIYSPNTTPIFYPWIKQN